MALTPYSLLTAFLWSSVFILILLALRGSRRRVSLFAGLTPYLILTAGVLFRCLVPMEFPFFTKALHGGGVVDALFDFLLQPSMSVVPTNWLIALLWVWLGGALVSLACFLSRYVRFSRRMSRYEPMKNQRVERIASQAAQRLKIAAPRLVEAVNINTPQVYGFFHPTVLLPNCEYTDEEYDLVFRHELQHWKNHDLWVKLLVELYSVMFWWNPFSYLLKRGLAETLELRCDENVVKQLSLEESLSYALVLQKTLEHGLNRRFKDRFYLIAEFSGTGDRAIRERFQRLLEVPQHPKARKVCTVVGAVLAIALFFASYTFVIQPKYDAPIEEIETDGYISVDSDSAFLTMDSDGNYYLTLGEDSPFLVKEETAEFLMEYGTPIYQGKLR